MTTATEMRGRYALITGGSSGIGEALADQLAAKGANLVLVARGAEQLERVGTDLRRRHGVAVLCVTLSLDEQGAAHRLVEIVREAGIEVELLVNNAGMSSRALVVDSDPAALRRLVDLNVGATTELTALMVEPMVHRGHGSLINIASTGAYTPAPYLAAYAASKAYILSFTQALWAETRTSGVRVVAVSPGPTQTLMNSRPGFGKRQPAQVASTVLDALQKSGPVVVDGTLNRVTTFLVRLIPARHMANLALKTMRSR